MVSEKESNEERDVTEEEDSVEENERKANLNSNLMIGVDSPKTMKLIEEIGERKVIALINSRVTHNFISKNLVAELKISVHMTRYIVVLGDSKKIMRVGRCEGIQLALPKLTIQQNFLPSVLEGWMSS